MKVPLTTADNPTPAQRHSCRLLLKDDLVAQGVSGLSGSRGAMALTSLAGLPQQATERILALLAVHPDIQRVLLYGSRALGVIALAELLVLGAQLDDLQLRHLIHPIAALVSREPGLVRASAGAGWLPG